MRQYLPHALLSRDDEGPGCWSREGTLVFSDVSGFTSLSEKLARHGRAGAEEMVTALSTVFTPLLAEIKAQGGDVLKFGGDALLSFFEGVDSAARAAWCANRMRALLPTVGLVQTPFGQVRLGMSQGLHTADISFFLCGDRHRELLVTGGATTHALAMESAAGRGEVLVSRATAARLPTAALGASRDGGVLLRRSSVLSRPGTPLPEVATAGDLRPFVPLALRGRLAQVVGDSEHRIATVAFLQLQGCDEVLARDGARALHGQVERVVERVVDDAERFGVTVVCTDVSSDGAKFMLVTGAPEADERDAESMLRFGLSVLGELSPLPLRMGVNRGPVYGGRVGAPSRWTYSTMGDAVNLAARVTGKAEPGRLLATRAVLSAAGSHVGRSTTRSFTVKGKSQPVEAAVVTHVAARHAGPRSRLLGRDDELEKLTTALGQLDAGRGGVLEVVGGPGSGKSRLAAELVDRVLPATRLLTVSGERYHRATPYFVAQLLLCAIGSIDPNAAPDEIGAELTHWVAAAAPDLVPWLPLLAVASRAVVAPTDRVDALAPEFRTARTHAVVEALLASVLTGPSVLLLEDVSWFDDASADLLAAVLPQCGPRPWLAFLTRRDEPTGLRLGPGLDREVVTLAPLSREAALALVRATSGGADLPLVEAGALADRAAGNPLFLLLLVQAAADGPGALPDDVEAVVAARLDRLPPAARRLLRHAAVLGAFVDLTLLGELLDEPVPTQVWQQVHGEFLIDTGSGYSHFVNDLFRTVAYDSLPFRKRRELHLRAGLALEDRDATSSVAALLSLHFEAAGDRERTWRYSVAAADQARAASANREAAELYDRALRAAAGRAAAQVSPVAEALGDVHELVGSYAAASDAYRLARRTGASGIQTLRLLRKEGILRERQGRYREALRWYARGLSVAVPDDPDASGALAALHVGVAAARFRQGKLEASVAAALAAVPLAKSGGDRSELAHAYYLLDAALTDLQDPEALTYRQLALPIYRELGDLAGQADVLNNTGVDAYYEGRWSEAVELYRASRRCRELAGDEVGAATADNNIAEVLCDLGRFDEAEPLFDEALRVWRRAGYTVGVALASSNLGRTLLRRDRPLQAAPLLEQAEHLFAAMGADALRFETQVRQLEVLVHLGEGEQALGLVAQLAATARTMTPSPVVLASLARAHGSALVMTGQEEQGRGLLQSALIGFEAAGMSWDADATRAQLAVVPMTD